MTTKADESRIAQQANGIDHRGNHLFANKLFSKNTTEAIAESAKPENDAKSDTKGIRVSDAKAAPNSPATPTVIK